MANILVIGGEGYVGRRLVDWLKPISRHSITVWDRGYYSHLPPTPAFDMKYLSKDMLSIYDTIILLAGHSSVALCSNDPNGSFKNNVVNFQDLLSKIHPDTKFIYASSASVYGSYWFADEESALPTPKTDYDMQKQIIDKIALNSGKNIYGLRFGTVCGYSPNPRNELIINSMFCDAVNHKQISVSSPDAYRAILGMTDLCRAISTLIDSNIHAPGVYNVSSFNSSILSIAQEVKDYMPDTALVVSENTTTQFSFTLNTASFVSTFDFPFMDTVKSIVHDLEKLPPHLRQKTIFNRSTNLFVY